MTLIMTLLVRDEADIVRENIEFHLARGVDHIIATDNGSRDGTTEILQEYEKSNVLTLIHEPSADYQQEPWVNRMVRLAQDEFDDTWIINNDADEFWRPPDRLDGRPGSLKHVVEQAQASAMVCRRHNMVASLADFEVDHWAKTLIWRSRAKSRIPKAFDFGNDKFRQPYFLYGLPDKVLVSAKGLVGVSKGAHSAEFKVAVAPERCGIEIFHYPIRSKAEFDRSVLQISQAVERDPAITGTMSAKYLRWGRMRRETGSIDTALQEALPSRFKQIYYRAKGIVVNDSRLINDLVALGIIS